MSQTLALAHLQYFEGSSFSVDSERYSVDHRRFDEGLIAPQLILEIRIAVSRNHAKQKRIKHYVFCG